MSIDPELDGLLAAYVGSEPQSILMANGACIDVEKLLAEVGRNEPCPCESGKKFKKCCISERK